MTGEGWHFYVYVRPDGSTVVLGSWDAPGPRPLVALMHITDDRATAEEWREALARGELPETRTAAPPTREWGRAIAAAAVPTPG